MYELRFATQQKYMVVYTTKAPKKTKKKKCHKSGPYDQNVDSDSLKIFSSAVFHSIQIWQNQDVLHQV